MMRERSSTLIKSVIFAQNDAGQGDKSGPTKSLAKIVDIFVSSVSVTVVEIHLRKEHERAYSLLIAALYRNESDSRLAHSFEKTIGRYPGVPRVFKHV